MTALVDKMRQLPLLLRLAGLGVTGAGGAALLTVSGAEGGLAIAGFALLALVAVIVLVWLLRIWFSARERKKSARLHEALVSGRSQLAVSDDDLQKLAELRDQWRKAVEQLKGAQLDPYSMPWYLLIGEPQSGKTTTIRNSGLEFPVGTDALSGPEGTRNCDFWFTNQAVILDTAGRYTFQEWDRPYSKEFEEFLRLLRRFRARCPINGVIVSIPSTSLLGDDDATRDAKAKNIRDKLQTIEQILEVQFPVYLLITKCDLVLGFTEFFGKLPALEQRQLLGWSNPEPFGNGFTPEMFDRGFAALAAELERWRLKFLAESTGSDLDRLFGFPDEFAVLRSRLHDYVTTIFSENRYADPLFFRGFYFTSGLQKGRPMSKACASLMRSADGGPDAKDLAEIFERSSAFFIRDFYKRKLFPEKGLISPTRRFLKRRRQIEQGAYLGAGSLGAILVVTLVWWIIAIDTPFQAPRTAVEQSAQLPGTASLADALADAENLLGNIRHIQQHGLEAGLLPWHKLVGEDKTRIVKAMGNVLVKRVIDRVVSPVAQSVEAILIDAPPPQAPYGPGSAYWKAAEEYLALRSWQKLASMGERDQGAAVRDTWTHIDGMLQLIADLGPATDTFPQINENRARISELYKAMVALHAPPWSVETDLAHVLTRRMNEASAKICTTVRDYWNALIANQFASPQTEAAEALAWRRIAEWDALLKSKYQQCLKIDWPEQPGRRGDVEAMVTTFKTLVGEPRVGIRALRASLDQEIAERPQRGISIGASLKQQLSSFDGCYAGWMVLAGNDRVLRDQLDNDRKGLGQRLEEKCRDAEGALSAGGFYVEVESAKPAEGAKAADKQAAPAWTLKVKPAVAKSVQVLEALFLVCEQADKTSDALQGTDTVAVA
ncbi:MAG: type VI secretion protein IcmF/TssM N-terminal domain-containing protein, partial [Planctomycetota bacterium]